MTITNPIGLTAIPTDAKRCTECEGLCDDESDGGPIYECGECGSTYNRETAGSHRCPDCGKFGSRIADESCPHCEAGELEEDEAFQCTHCEVILDEPVFATHDCREAVARSQASEAERKAREAERELRRAGRRAEIQTLPLKVVIQKHHEPEYDEPSQPFYFYICEVNGVIYGGTDTGFALKTRKGKHSWEAVPYESDWETAALRDVVKLPTHRSQPEYSTPLEAAEAMAAWVAANFPPGTAVTLNHSLDPSQECALVGTA